MYTWANSNVGPRPNILYCSYYGMQLCMYIARHFSNGKIFLNVMCTNVHTCMCTAIYRMQLWMFRIFFIRKSFLNIICTMCIRGKRFRGVFKKFLKCNKQELPKVVPHHNEETPKFFWKSVNIFRWRKWDEKTEKNLKILYIYIFR